ncbi:MAG: hypothetical protein FD146_1064 [Anaerolineaceae bacterium]|nr:MAG: hypothetical protein FD146_1064 [Anaerolineaceae bacterium]
MSRFIPAAERIQIRRGLRKNRSGSQNDEKTPGFFAIRVLYLTREK